MSAGGLTFNRRAVRPMTCLREGWQLIKEDYWLFLGITFIGALLGGAAFGLLMGPMMCGIYLCLLRREAGQRISFDMLFKGFDYFAQGLIAWLIMVMPILVFVGLFYVVFFLGMFAFMASVAAQPGGQPPDLAVTWMFIAAYGVGVVGMILISLLLGALFLFIFPLIVDRGLSGFEAIKLSARAALANFGGVVGLTLVLWLLLLVGEMACFVGLYLVYPVFFAVIAVAYRQVFPVEGSVLFEPPPPNWPATLEPVARPEQTGIQGVQDSPLTPTKPPEEPRIQQAPESSEERPA